MPNFCYTIRCLFYRYWVHSMDDYFVLIAMAPSKYSHTVCRLNSPCEWQLSIWLSFTHTIGFHTNTRRPARSRAEVSVLVVGNAVYLIWVGTIARYGVANSRKVKQSRAHSFQSSVEIRWGKMAILKFRCLKSCLIIASNSELSLNIYFFFLNKE